MFSSFALHFHIGQHRGNEYKLSGFACYNHNAIRKRAVVRNTEFDVDYPSSFNVNESYSIGGLVRTSTSSIYVAAVAGNPTRALLLSSATT